VCVASAACVCCVRVSGVWPAAPPPTCAGNTSCWIGRTLQISHKMLVSQVSIHAHTNADGALSFTSTRARALRTCACMYTFTYVCLYVFLCVCIYLDVSIMIHVSVYVYMLRWHCVYIDRWMCANKTPGFGKQLKNWFWKTVENYSWAFQAAFSDFFSKSLVLCSSKIERSSGYTKTI